MAFPTIYVDTGGSATNSGSSDNNAADLSGTNASCNPSSTTVDLSTDSPDLSGVATDGSATIFLADATNSNQKIFKITGVDNGAKTVTVDVAPTGNFTTSNWAIGGRFVWTQASIEGALAAGWTVQFNNSPASHSGSAWLTCRAAGDADDGVITVQAASGIRPVITVTDDNDVINSGGQAGWHIKGLELSGTASGSSDAINCVSGYEGWRIEDVKISDAPARGFDGGGTSSAVLVNCEVGAVGDGGIAFSGQAFVFGCYCHDCAQDAFQMNGSAMRCTLAFCIADTVGGDGYDLTSSSISNLEQMVVLQNCTAYACGNGSTGDSSVEVTDKDAGLVIYNNIFSSPDNGYNIDLENGTGNDRTSGGYNIYHNPGSVGNFRNFTVFLTDLGDVNPQFVDPANGDFRLGSSSPARQVGWPGEFPGGLSTGYLDIGAVQAIEATSPVQITTPMNLGNVPENDTISVFFNSFGMSGEAADIVDFGVNDIEIYKDGSDVQRASNNGYVVDANHDGRTGQGRVTIDLSDNSDTGYFAVGSYYSVCVEGITLGDQSVRACIAQFRIVHAEAEAGVPATDADLIKGDSSAAWSLRRFFETLVSSDADSGTTTTLTDSGRIGDGVDKWVGWDIWFPDGSGTGTEYNTARVTAFDNGTGQITFSPALSVAIAANDPYIFVPPLPGNVEQWNRSDVHTVSEVGVPKVDIDQIRGDTSAADVLQNFWNTIASDWNTADSGTTTTLVDAALTSGDTDDMVGSLVFFISGNNKNRSRLVTAFDPGTDTITFAPALPDAVTTESYFFLPFGAANVVEWLGAAVETPDTAGVPHVDVERIDGDATAAIKLKAWVDSFKHVTGGGSTWTVESVSNAALSESSDHWNRQWILITTGTYAGLARQIVQFSATNDRIDFRPELPGTPAASDEYIILPAGGVDLISIWNNHNRAEVLGDFMNSCFQATADSGTTTTVVDSGLTQADDSFIGYMIVWENQATNFGHMAIVTDMDQASNTITFSPAMPSAVSSGDKFVLIPLGANVLGWLDALPDNAIADAILDRADGIEVGLTFRQAMRLGAAVWTGKVSGAGTGTEVFRNAIADSKARVTATVDAVGNRTAITYDAD